MSTTNCLKRQIADCRGGPMCPPAALNLRKGIYICSAGDLRRRADTWVRPYNRQLCRWLYLVELTLTTTNLGKVRHCLGKSWASPWTFPFKAFERPFKILWTYIQSILNAHSECFERKTFRGEVNMSKVIRGWYSFTLYKMPVSYKKFFSFLMPQMSFFI